MYVFHKVGTTHGVMVDGHTVFSGSLQACLQYIALFLDS